MTGASDQQFAHLLPARSTYRKSAVLCAVLGHSVMSNSLWPHGPYSPWNFPGQNTGVGISLLQGIFPTQGSNPGLLHCRQILYCLNHQGSPRILEWVAYPFSRGNFRPRNWTGVSCIAVRLYQQNYQNVPPKPFRWCIFHHITSHHSYSPPRKKFLKITLKIYLL